VGECSGFADPILSAGVTMAHIGARQAAYTIMELDRGEWDAAWLRNQFESRQKQRIETHIRFGDYWYTANQQLKDLKEFTSQLARDSGLDLSPKKAWDWLASGGFINEDLNIGAGGFSLDAIRDSGDFLAKVAFESPLETNNVVTLNIQGAEQREFAIYANGRVTKAPCYYRGGRVLPLSREVELLIAVLQNESKVVKVFDALNALAQAANLSSEAAGTMTRSVHVTLEAMIHDGWVKARLDPREPVLKLVGRGSGFHWNRDNRPS